MSHAVGTKFEVTAPRSRFYQGPFGRICADLEPWRLDGVAECGVDERLLEIANTLMIERPELTPGEIAADPALIADLDAEFGSRIPAGYTYFGQFIDHDVTFDTASSLQRRNDPSGLLNFRTPRLDLDNVYGRGPADQPYLYEGPHDRATFLIGTVPGTNLRDLPRNSVGRALIGDMRNDENSMVSQLQLAFLLAHNELVSRAITAGHEEPFEAARTTLRWLYQWVVWQDFVKRIVIDDVHAAALSNEKLPGGRRGWVRNLRDVYNWKHQPFMPVEFSVAAYRFGHSMVRNSYQTNHPHRGFEQFAPIFDNSPGGNPDDLRGFTPMRPENVIQWDWFLPMASSGGPFPQAARRIDPTLANALAFLHEAPTGDPMNVLAFRNLKRGLSFDLPSGTSVAEKFCVKPIALADEEPDALWYYILKEAGSLPGANRGQSLGRVGSIIVAATFAGLLAGDPLSWVNIAPCWTPGDDPLLRDGDDNRDDPDWKLSSIIRLAGLPVDADDVTAQT